MKNLLSENMLRFGTKNLSEAAQKKLILKSIMETINQHGLHEHVKYQLMEQNPDPKSSEMINTLQTLLGNIAKTANALYPDLVTTPKLEQTQTHWTIGGYAVMPRTFLWPNDVTKGKVTYLEAVRKINAAASKNPTISRQWVSCTPLINSTFNATTKFSEGNSCAVLNQYLTTDNIPKYQAYNAAIEAVGTHLKKAGARPTVKP